MQTIEVNKYEDEWLKNAIPAYIGWWEEKAKNETDEEKRQDAIDQLRIWYVGLSIEFGITTKEVDMLLSGKIETRIKERPCR